MKRILIALFTVFACCKTFAAEVPLYVFPDVLEYAIKKHFSTMDQNAVVQEWEKRMTTDGTVTASDVHAVCKTGRINNEACDKFRKDLMTYFYPVCDKKSDKGKSTCVNDFWAITHGTWVRLPEAIEIAKAYAQVKNNETVVCSPSARSVNLPTRASYIKCTSVDGGHYYEFKFNSTGETTDRDIISGTLRAIGKIHDTEFKNSDCTLERICADSNCALSYKTEDNGKCGKISNTLNSFGYNSKMVNSEKFGKRCEVFGLCGGNRTIYGLDNTVFQDVQYVAGPEVEKNIKEYVQRELGRQGVELKTFKCDKSTKHDYSNAALDGMIKKHNEILTCYVNGSPIDFLFQDLSEGKDYAKDAGLSKMACAKIGGKIDGRDCRGLDKKECLRVSHKIPGGTIWDPKAEVCILNKADIEKKVNDRIQILGGLVIAVGVGTLVAPAVASATGVSETSYILLSGVGSVIADQGFIQIDRLEELKPKKYAYEFVNDALTCGIPSGITQCNRTEVDCAIGVISKHFGRLDEIIDKLDDSQLKSVAEAMENVTGCLDDKQFADALNTITPSTNFKDKLTNQAGLFWLIAGIFVSPENSVTKLATRAPKIAKVLNRCRVLERVSGSLNGAKYIRIYVDNLDSNEIKRLVSAFEKRGIYVSSNLEQTTNRRFLGVADMDVFKNWRNSSGNWLLNNDINSLKNKISSRFDERVSIVLTDQGTVLWERYRATDAEWEQLNNYLNNQGLELIDDIDDKGQAAKRLQKIGFNRNVNNKQYINRVSDNSIFSKVYNNYLSDDVIYAKLDYVYKHSSDKESAIRALKEVNIYDAQKTTELANDLANEAVRRIRNNPELIERMRRYRSLNNNEKVALIDDLHEIITTERRNHVGNTQIFHDFNTSWSYANGKGTSDSGFVFKYGMQLNSIEDMISIVFHENTHALQRLGKSALPEQFVDWNLSHYLGPNSQLYYDNIIEIEAYAIGDQAGHRVAQILGLY